MIYTEILKQVREEKNITQSKIATTLGIDQSVYSHYETEYNIIPLKHLIFIANYFDVSIDYLFGFTNVKQYNKKKQEVLKETVGLNLKKFRKERKITQAKLASMLNTTQSVIADYERGRYLIATPFLYTICKKYNISADYLIGRID